MDTSSCSTPLLQPEPLVEPPLQTMPRGMIADPGESHSRGITPFSASSNQTSDVYELSGGSEEETPKSFWSSQGAPIAGLVTYADHAMFLCKEKVHDAQDLLSSVAKRIWSVKSAAASQISSAPSQISSARSMASSICHKIRTKGPVACVSDAAKFSREVAVAKLEAGKARAIQSYNSSYEATVQALRSAKLQGMEASVRAKATTIEVVSDGKFQATAAAGAGGAVALGAFGGTAGLVAGSVSGAALGVIPALFTFGLSIPVGAVVGGGFGLVAGTSVGGTVGAATGCAVGYTKEKEIRSGAGKVWSTVSEGAKLAKGKTSASADYVKDKVSEVKAKLVGGGTGGTH
eukprot:CAMPEP_0170619218 /NCGR_PEP_ID=MMETSP0224-20130122/27400_1 /TAXON_ID=285029 /ORGANISM="Togula jolla, Strain CCCM 725" /LENGTH=346 /DNA_ID=CAMNT_0010945295 /DNA_START=110 /DNA_END=1150 /DNA_ORIENTATION=+